MASARRRVSQCQKPSGWMGRLTLWSMNARHSKLTDWGLQYVSVAQHYTALDVGCGGGRTISKLAAVATAGKVYGIDFSEASVAASKRTNARGMDEGRVDIQHASVSQLPFPDGMFDLVTGVETHFWWPDLPGAMREIFRVVKPGGKLILIAEIYKGANKVSSKLIEKYAALAGMTLLSTEEHRELFANTGYSDVQVVTDVGKGWICATGKKE
ncbi:MAG TPA: class I SAM-dependent methyltransferase [Candidatus Acidoferrum sp.]|nr:class I SAM-dependent methyltransferase [Candidatus Acidoferrum sp.]